jgi:hypothetical protein
MQKQDNVHVAHLELKTKVWELEQKQMLEKQFIQERDNGIKKE